MANEPSESDKQQLNAGISMKIYSDAKTNAILMRLKLWQYVENALALIAYFKENLPSFKETKKIVSITRPEVCLQVARADLIKKGYTQQDIAELDAVIAKVEAFLQNEH